MEPQKNIIDALIENEAALRYFLTRKVGCAHTSADLFQRIALKLLRQKRRPATDNARAYLYRAANCEAVSYRRSEYRRSSYESECVYLQDEFDRHGADEPLAEETLRLIDEALRTLPPLTREIFLLCRVKGVKQSVVAAQLGLSLSSVEKRLAAALKHSRSRLECCDGNPK
ncbi:MAG TPA: RNA polymerase sigma factor [Steroidobacter sp.]